MKRRIPPRTVSKRFQRKLRRSKSPFFLWLQCKRPAVYARLRRFWKYQLIELCCNIDPINTPFFSLAPGSSIDLWRIDA